jgi:N6-adenosine-specific RNA methylase IME4
MVVPSAHLDEAMSMLSTWGFTYRDSIVWVSEAIEPALYTQTQHALLLIATKGYPPASAPSSRPASVLFETEAEDDVRSRTFYEVIERMFPELPRVALLTEAERDGWLSWGGLAAAV